MFDETSWNKTAVFASHQNTLYINLVSIKVKNSVAHFSCNFTVSEVLLWLTNFFELHDGKVF